MLDLWHIIMNHTNTSKIDTGYENQVFTNRPFSITSFSSKIQSRILFLLGFPIPVFVE